MAMIVLGLVVIDGRLTALLVPRPVPLFNRSSGSVLCSLVLLGEVQMRQHIRLVCRR